MFPVHEKQVNGIWSGCFFIHVINIRGCHIKEYGAYNMGMSTKFREKSVAESYYNNGIKNDGSKIATNILL